MNKYSIITTIAIIVIIIPFVYSGSSIVGAQQLEYRWYSPGEFSFFTMSNHGEIEVCNTLPFWISLERLKISTFYNSNQLGSFVTEPLTINPSTSSVQKGTFSSEQLSAAQHNFMTLDFQFNGGEMRLDPNKFIVVIDIDTPILGIIPYYSTTQISGFEFDKMMNAENLSCN
jgi:hypothetical protein